MKLPLALALAFTLAVEMALAVALAPNERTILDAMGTVGTVEIVGTFTLGIVALGTVGIVGTLTVGILGIGGIVGIDALGTLV